MAMCPLLLLPMAFLLVDRPLYLAAPSHRLSSLFLARPSSFHTLMLVEALLNLAATGCNSHTSHDDMILRL